MKRILYIAVCAALGAGHPAQALGGLADVEIIDRDSGETLTPHYYRGEYWVAGKPGSRYAIEIRNRLGERVLAVTSVDGVNVISGENAAWTQTGYVFSPRQNYEITGWRKSDAEIAAFTFTDASGSYAELTGRPGNVGVIGVALFRERAAPSVYTPRVAPPERLSGGLPPGSDASSRAAPAPSAPAGAGGMVPPTAQGGATLQGHMERFKAPSPSIAQAPAPEPKLGTGHGEREYSYITHTDFARQQPEPNEVIRIRYDSLDNLLAMGVIKRPRPVPPTTNPFPGSPEQQYVPDPPG
jgi:hypothetical protein